MKFYYVNLLCEYTHTQGGDLRKTKLCMSASGGPGAEESRAKAPLWLSAGSQAPVLTSPFCSLHKHFCSARAL